MSVFRPGLFKDKVAIVTGGATGIGKAITQELVTLGCKVVIASRKEQKLQEAVAELNPSGNFVKYKVCNIREEHDVKGLVSSTIEDLGRIDFLVNNGGGQFLSSVENMSTKGFKAVVDTNLTGTFNLCKEVHSQYMKENGGSIVNIIADMFRGFPMMAHTGAARSAVDNLTKSLAVEWAEKGIRINAVAPGAIYSSTAAENYGKVKIFEFVKDKIPARRAGSTCEVSSAVCFLLSPGASFISGATLRVDAGGSLYSPLFYRISEHEKLPPYDWTYEPPQEDTADEKNKSKL